MSLSTSGQKFQALRLPNPDATVDNDDKFALLGLIETQTTPSTGISTALKRLILRLPTPDATVDNADKFAVLGLYDPQNVGGPIIQTFEVTWFLDPTSFLAEATYFGVVETAINQFSASFSAETDPTTKKKGGRVRRGFRRGFIIEHRGQMIPLASLDEVDAFLERKPDAKLVVHEVEESATEEMYYSPSLHSDELKAIYGERPRLVPKYTPPEGFTLPERTRFALRDVPEKRGDSIPERQRFVTSDPVASQDNIPDRPRFIQKKTKSEDPLMKILRKRTK
jgi:hypothetical protein